MWGPVLESVKPLLRCPVCGSELSEPLRCEPCELSFPALSGIPCLFEDAAERWRGWQLETGIYERLSSASAAGLEAQAKEPVQLSTTRARVERLAQATRDNARTILGLLSDAGLEPASSSSNAEPKAALALLEYQDHVLRDWAPGLADEENAAAHELVVEARKGDADWGTTLVLGAGACRLAYDIATGSNAPSMTLALDISPLPLLAAKRLCEGETLNLIELPQVPADAASVAVEHRLEAPRGLPRALYFVLADAFKPPLPKAAFDTVVTPWFIDIVPRDARESIGLIHGLLRPGGLWLNYGPLSYPKEHPAAWRYTADELRELVALAGFELGHFTTSRSTLLSSAASGRQRSEQVLAFGLRKRDAEDQPENALPSWLLFSHLPIPRFWPPEFPTPREPPLAYLMRQIDGERTLADIADRLIREGSARPEAALGGTRALVTLLYERVKFGA